MKQNPSPISKSKEKKGKSKEKKDASSKSRGKTIRTIISSVSPDIVITLKKKRKKKELNKDLVGEVQI